MTLKAKDSLDVVEMVMEFEEVFDTEIPDDEAEHCGSPSEIVDRLERWLSNQRPNKQAASKLGKLAKEQQRPELAEGLDGTWRPSKYRPSSAKSSETEASEGSRRALNPFRC